MSRICTWEVEGMHCASCERVIALELKKIPGVEEAEASLSSKQAKVRLADGAPPPSDEELNRLLAPFGYRAASQRQAACEIAPARLAFIHRLSQAGLAVLAVMLAGWALLRPLLSLVPSLQVGTSYAALFGLGLVASVSTCLASTGAFLLAYSAESRSRNKLFLVHAGRLGAFLLGGAILGGVGGALPSDARFYGAIALVLGIGFLMVALHLLELSPSLASIGIRLPRSLNRLQDRVMKSEHKVAPLLAGAATFVLPCGFTQTAQAIALASGSPLVGALMMGAFAMGTLPTLLGVTAIGGSRLLNVRAFRLAAGAVMLLFAVGQIDGGLTVYGSEFTLAGFGQQLLARTQGAFTIQAAQAEEQIVRMTVAYGTFSPSRMTIRRGVPVRWEVDGVDIGGCASTIVAPSIGISRQLAPGLNVISFTPSKAGTIPFSCSMGMIRGSFQVIE